MQLLEKNPSPPHDAVSIKANDGILFRVRRTMMLALALLTISYGHAQMTGYYPKGGPGIAAEDVSLIQLIANPQAYDGKAIRIIGFVHLEFEAQVIYLHEEDFHHGLNRDGLWIDLPRN